MLGTQEMAMHQIQTDRVKAYAACKNKKVRITPPSGFLCYTREGLAVNKSGMSSGIGNGDEVSPPLGTVDSLQHHMHLFLLSSCYNHFDQEVCLKDDS